MIAGLGTSRRGKLSVAITTTVVGFQKAMEADRTNAVEGFTGRKVIAFVSGHNISSGIASERFILDSTSSPTTSGPVPPPQMARTIDGYAALRAGRFRTRTCVDKHPLVRGPVKPRAGEAGEPSRAPSALAR